MRIDSKLEFEFEPSGCGILHIEFWCNGSKVGKLIRPTYKDYAVNVNDMSSGFIKFTTKVILKEDAAWVVDSSTRIAFTVIYKAYNNLIDLGVEGMYLPSLNTADIKKMQSIWYDLIRLGFRPSLGMFS